jgi:hypothetical protein
MFEVGDRVTWTQKAIEYNLPTRKSRNVLGTVINTWVGENDCTHTVAVLWDGYKHPIEYAGSFITRARKAKSK